ncbi:MAG: phycobilisome degradation protein NblA [Cyanothece sp. SIO2G6]|nr:phycobilisome degradation protein NblA [Cyanothece sp. SIO2G6]
MQRSAKLSLEQQFQLQVHRKQVKSLDLEQAQQYLLELLRQMMLKDNQYKEQLYSK